MTEKFIGYLRLIEACRQGGCPVCRRVAEESRTRLGAILHEHVTDPDTRRALRDSWGFCNWHTWMLREVDTSLFGASILYEDLLSQAIDRVTSLVDRPRPKGLGAWLTGLGARLTRLASRDARPDIGDDYGRRPACPLCLTAAETERHCLLTFVACIEDGDLQAAYASSDPLCLAHVLRASEVMSGSPEVRILVERTQEKWQAIRRALRSFIEKHDHRNQTAYTAEDADSYVRAFEILAGARGLFGNDLGAGRGTPRKPNPG